jgi:hypothetical protein
MRIVAPTVRERTPAMTVTATAEQLLEEEPADNTTERAERTGRTRSVEELAALLAQAYAGMPLFP